MADVTAVKPSNSKAATALRHKLFIERWLVNGNNATEAALYAGYGTKNAAAEGSRLLHRDDIKELIGARAARVLQTAVLSTERWANEMAAIGHLDPGELYDADGNTIPVHKLPEHVRRAIASVKREQRIVGRGEEREVVQTEEIKLHDKNTALANIGRHLGVFEKDNKQNITAIQVNVTYLD